jgi:predicted amidohydrolase YtcJ
MPKTATPHIAPLAALLAPLLIATAHAQPADLVITNARIWSEGLDTPAPAAAVRDGRFIHVGPLPDGMTGPDTTVIDAAGRVVIPGLIDSHVHMLGGGMQLARLHLRDAADRDDFIARVREWAAQLPEDEWILGGRWSTESWDRPQTPSKDWIDPVTGGRPAFLTRMDGHSALVNSKALQLAGITRDGPPDPPGGVIDRDPATGEPTGILRESAMGLASRHIPREDRLTHVTALKRAMAHANAHGITAVADIPAIGDLETYAQLARETDLTVRFFLYPTASDWRSAVERADRFQGKDGWLTVRGFKAYLDGTLGSRTAYMRRPFLPPADADTSGAAAHLPPRGVLREGVPDGRFMANAWHARNSAPSGARTGAESGPDGGAGLPPAPPSYQTIAHAIGDQANHLLLEILDAVYGDSLPAARCRSEHAQHLLAEDIARFAELGVIASMQPYHKTDDGRYAESYIGPDRSRSSYAFRSLLEAGAVVAFGSDWPVVTINPFLGIEAAVTGRTLDGAVWQPQENITVEQALACYTAHAAYAVFAEHEIGRIAPGYRADFVILNASPFEENVDWSTLAPVAVYVDGREVYRAD